MITMTRRRWIVAAVALVVLAGLASAIALFFIDEPLRRYTEAKMNARLQGYTATIGALHFSPSNVSLELRDTVIVQHEHPDPPVANIGRLYASVHWRALLAGRVVGDILIDRPVVVLDLPQAKEEIDDATPVSDPHRDLRPARQAQRRHHRDRRRPGPERVLQGHPARLRGPPAPPLSRRRRFLPAVFSDSLVAMAEFKVVCPCCDGRLTIDPALEAVIAHEPAPRAKSGLGLDDALASLKGAEARRAERFKEELKAQEKKPQVLDKMFKEGIKKAKDMPGRPLNPLDLD
jgi:hypothetical protein